MKLSGIAIQKYFTHSTRSAASSEANSLGVLLKNIKFARWKSDKTLAQHYEKQTEEKLVFVFNRMCIYCNNTLVQKIIQKKYSFFIFKSSLFFPKKDLQSSCEFSNIISKRPGN